MLLTSRLCTCLQRSFEVICFVMNLILRMDYVMYCSIFYIAKAAVVTFFQLKVMRSNLISAWHQCI